MAERRDPGRRANFRTRPFRIPASSRRTEDLAPSGANRGIHIDLARSCWGTERFTSRGSSTAAASFTLAPGRSPVKRLPREPIRGRREPGPAICGRVKTHPPPPAHASGLDGLPPFRLPQVIVPVQFDQPLKHLDFTAELFAPFRVGHPPGPVPFANDFDPGNDVEAILEGRVNRLKVVVAR